jgi:hypothetical protein
LIVPFRRLLIVLSLVAFNALIQAQSVIWQSRYATVSPGNDALFASVLDAKGCVYTAARVDELVNVTKFDRRGAVLWKQNYLSKVKGPHFGIAMNLDSAGNLVLYTSYRGTSGQMQSIVRIKSATGALTSASSLALDFGPTINKVLLDSANNIYLFTQTTVYSNSVSKLTPTGALVWTKALPWFEGSDFAVDPAGNVYCCGTVPRSSDNPTEDAILVRVNSDGTDSWTFRNQESKASYGRQVVVGPNGSIYFAGTGRFGTTGFYTYELIGWKLDAATGAKIWTNRYTPNQDIVGLVGTCYTEANSGDFIVSGQDTASPFIKRFASATGAISGQNIPTLNYSSGQVLKCRPDGAGGTLLLSDYYVGGYPGPHELRLARVNNAGTTLWTQSYPAANIARLQDSDFLVDPADNSVAVTATTYAGLWLLNDTLVQRTSLSLGTPINQVTTDTLRANLDRFYKVAKASDGGWAALCLEHTEQDGWHGVVRRYAPDGSLLWSTSILNPKIDDPWEPLPPFKRLAVGADGSVVVAGVVGGAHGNGDLWAMKLHKTTGAPMWSKSWDGPDGIEDELGGVSLDGAGNVYLSGVDRTYSSEYDTVVVKLASKAGDLLWAQKYDDVKPAGPGNISVFSGFALVSGTIGVNAERRPVLFRISTDDGHLLWLNRFGGPDNQGYLDGFNKYSNGDVLAIGTRNVPGGTNNGTLLTKLSAATGQTIWEKLSNGAPGDVMAFDAAGNPIVFGQGYLDAFVTKYSAQTGDLLWKRAIDGPETSDDDRVGYLSLDPLGNVFITGKSIKHNANGDVEKPYIAALSGATGVVRWYTLNANPTVDLGFPAGLITSADGYPLYFGNVFTFGFDGGNDDGLISKLDLPTFSRTFSGTLTLLSYLADPTLTPITMEVRVAGTTTVVSSRTIHVASDLSFAESFDLKDGKYDVTFKASHWLRRKIANLTAIDSTSFSLGSVKLINADVNGDNVVDDLDRQAVAAALGSVPGSGNWNPEADLNGDGRVNAKDATIVENNFGKIGQ